jgi:hypothetical protein
MRLYNYNNIIFIIINNNEIIQYQKLIKVIDINTIITTQCYKLLISLHLLIRY